MPTYDVIGDIHGYADKLRALLGRLGYEQNGGVYGSPDRDRSGRRRKSPCGPVTHKRRRFVHSPNGSATFAACPRNRGYTDNVDSGHRELELAIYR